MGLDSAATSGGRTSVAGLVCATTSAGPRTGARDPSSATCGPLPFDREKALPFEPPFWGRATVLVSAATVFIGDDGSANAKISDLIGSQSSSLVAGSKLMFLISESRVTPDDTR